MIGFKRLTAGALTDYLAKVPQDKPIVYWDCNLSSADVMFVGLASQELDDGTFEDVVMLTGSK